MTYIYSTIYALFLWIFLLLLIPLLSKLNFILKEKVLIKRLQFGIISTQDLYNFGYSSFKRISKIFLENEGYINIKSAKLLNHNDVDFICSIRNNETYVQCILEDLSGRNNWEYTPISKLHVQNFLGQMVHDDIKIGVIITNGHFSQGAEEFVDRLYNEYNILLINGLSLTKYLKELKESDNLHGGLLYD